MRAKRATPVAVHRAGSHGQTDVLRFGLATCGTALQYWLDFAVEHVVEVDALTIAHAGEHGARCRTAQIQTIA